MSFAILITTRQFKKTLLWYFPNYIEKTAKILCNYEQLTEIISNFLAQFQESFVFTPVGSGVAAVFPYNTTL